MLELPHSPPHSPSEGADGPPTKKQRKWTTHELDAFVAIVIQHKDALQNSKDRAARNADCKSRAETMETIRATLVAGAKSGDVAGVKEWTRSESQMTAKLDNFRIRHKQAKDAAVQARKPSDERASAGRQSGTGKRGRTGLGADDPSAKVFKYYYAMEEFFDRDINLDKCGIVSSTAARFTHPSAIDLDLADGTAHVEPDPHLLARARRIKEAALEALKKAKADAKKAKADAKQAEADAKAKAASSALNAVQAMTRLCDLGSEMLAYARSITPPPPLPPPPPSVQTNLQSVIDLTKELADFFGVDSTKSIAQMLSELEAAVAGMYPGFEADPTAGIVARVAAARSAAGL